MQGILKAIKAAGLDAKAFSKEVDIDRYMMSKFVNGHCNPTPHDFKKICDRSGLAPDEVATVADVDYGVAHGWHTQARQARQTQKGSVPALSHSLQTAQADRQGSQDAGVRHDSKLGRFLHKAAAR